MNISIRAHLCIAGLLLSFASANAALLDVWRADDLVLNDGDTVGTWTSATNRTANATLGQRPTFQNNATPGGTAAVRFNGTHLMSAPSPVAGRSAFSVALVFRANTPGAGNNAQWWGKTGLVDAEEPGVTSDWGTVLNEAGQVGIGTGNGDNSTYSAGASLADGSYHAAVFTWGAGSQAVYVDQRAPVTQAGVSTTPRNNAGIAFGGIRTGEANRRLDGDLVEIRFYDTALNASEAGAVIEDLRDTHLLANQPRILSFTATPNQIYLGQSATLAWEVVNALSISIDNGLGTVAAQGNLLVSPTELTTYTITASNPGGTRQAAVTVMVDPGVPVALDDSISTPREVPIAILLQGTDPNGGMLSYAIVSQPAHGTLSGTPPNVTYTPSAGYAGPDSFTFRVNDGMFDSAPATIAIDVIPPATAPSGILLSSTNISANAGPGAFVAALQAVDVNIPQGDTHTFALVPGFGDNAQFAVEGGALRTSPSFVGGLGAGFAIRLRVTDSALLDYEQTFALSVSDVLRGVVINEIHYNSDDNTIPEEFIELHNPTDAPIDISSWRLGGGIDFFFPINTFISAGGFIVVAEDPATVQSRYGVVAFGPWEGGLNNEGEEVTLRDALNDVIDVVDFRSRFPWPIAPNGEGPSMELVNPPLDNNLGGSWRASVPSGNPALLPTPGRTNSVFAPNAAPQLRQVGHSPRSPDSADTVRITCRVTDPEGVSAVTLAYQVVLPGNYLPATLPLSAAQLNSLNSNPGLANPLNPAFEDAANWTTVPMRDDGLNGDDVAGDNTYTVVLPQRAHRTLVRYRITCEDALGLSRRAPFEDDGSLNFAYFVYDGLPAYEGFSAAVLESLPVYTLITRDTDLNECTAWFSPWSGTHQLPQNVGGTRNEGRVHFNWEGAIVYDGEVYDHIRYRLRGANGRYHNGKRNFRFRFNSGRYLDAKDQQGDLFPTQWRELTTGKGQSNRGSESFALNEVVNFFLWNKVGVPAPRTFHFHFRVIRGPIEEGTSRYTGDFWGLNWGQEKYDVNFLESHNLGRGNLYKLVDNFVLGVDERRYQGPSAPTMAEDFFAIENELSGFQSVEWLRSHANYTNWYRYFAIAEAIRHYDTWPSANKNGAWYFEPIYTPQNGFLGRLMQLPYDSTDTWGPTWNNGEDLLFNGIFPSSAAGGDSGQHPELQLEYRNVVREIRDLLFQPDQINAIIDAFAAPLLPFAEADFLRWRNAPSPASYAALIIPSSPGAASGLAAYVQDMKNFMFVGGNNSWWIDRQGVAAGGWVIRLDQVATDVNVPTRPTISYAGAGEFPVDGLVFESSPFADPQGAGTFASVQWRVAEINPPGSPARDVAGLRLEWDAAWDSGELPVFEALAAVPAGLLQPEHLYRARVRHKDNTGRWSRWSAPLEFRPRAVDLFTPLRRDLVFAEVMYNPPEEGMTDGDEFEFVELRNIGVDTLNLSGLFFSSGIQFSFTNETRLAAGEIFLLARNPAAFATRYPDAVVHGVYSGRLDNAGEKIALSHPVGGELVALEYDDRAPWPVTPDGYGFSLARAEDGSYRPGGMALGTPGAADSLAVLTPVVINELLSSSTAPLRDSVELFNAGAEAVDISGWYLTDDPAFPWKFRIPGRPPLQPGEFALFDETDFNPVPGLGTSFAFNSLGDDVYLFAADGPGEFSGYSHGFEFGAAQDGVSFGRHVNSVGVEQFPLQISRTFPGVNAGPRVGPVVISEIHYHPRQGADEFLELRNLSMNDVPLFDPAHPTNTWAVNGVGFSFPVNVILPAQGTILVVGEDPAAFRARFGVPPPVEIFQYSGALQDSGENLELLAPDVPAVGGVPYYAVDTVRYNDRSPWPLAADGAGASLQRRIADAYSNDPANWLAASPTPGSHALSGTVPAFVIQPEPAARTAALGGTATFAATVSGSFPLFYQWRVDGADIEGATNATLTLSDLSLEDRGAYSLIAFNSAGSAESMEAMLVVRIGPTITSHPTNVMVRVPPDMLAAPTTNVSFSVSAISFSPPLRYQWQLNGVDIAQATNSTLVVTNVQLSDEGAYTALVSDEVGTVPSQPAFLYPLILPDLISVPGNMTAVVGELISVSASATGSPLPFGWEWRRISAVIASNELDSRSVFFGFVNTNNPGTTVRYRVVVRSLSGQDTATFDLTTLADGDGDGMPDAWEGQFGLDLDDPTDALIDSDSDGLINRDEYLARTDPTDPGSALRLGIRLLGGQPAIFFDAVANRTYTLQHSPAPGFAPWQTLTDVLGGPEDRVETLLDPGWTSNRVYRVLTPRQ